MLGGRISFALSSVEIFGTEKVQLRSDPSSGERKKKGRKEGGSEYLVIDNAALALMVKQM